MKIAIVYNRESRSVINLFGVPNQETIGLKTVARLRNSLKAGGHQVESFEGDKDLIDNLEEFMPRVLKGERPGIVFNISYGIQGQARYTHVPSILEMVGVPYVGSGPLAHSLALDKVVAKMIFQQRGLSTPAFAVLESAGFEMPDLPFPLIVKPKNESVSFGIKVVHNEDELRDASQNIFDKFSQPVLAEQYIEGREINVGLLGNNPPDALPPAEILFGKDGPAIYTYEDKTRKSGREIGVRCPADLDAETTARAQELARGAFTALGCYDCARVDMRMDADGQLYILEVNSLPSLGEHGSYVQGAEAVGLDFTGLVNRLVEVASARYFGTPEPLSVEPGRKDPRSQVSFYLTERRDALEERVERWTRLTSRTADPVGLQDAARAFDKSMTDLKLRPISDLTDDRFSYGWETKTGLDGGTLLLAHLDVPLDPSVPVQVFRRDPEWLYGEGVASSRAGLAMIEMSLTALRSARQLHRLPIGVLAYTDEGTDCRYSLKAIKDAASRARRVLVLRPGNVGDRVITSRRGQRKYSLRVVGTPRRPGRPFRTPDVVRWTFERLERASQLSRPRAGLSVSVLDFKTEHYPVLLPHRISATLLVTYREEERAEAAEAELQKIFKKDGYECTLKLVVDRPPMKERRGGLALHRFAATLGEEWGAEVGKESSVWPSAAGLVPAKTAALCGLGPATVNLYTPQEAIQRISLLQRTLLLTGLLFDKGEKDVK